jgi:acyl-coenzyme A synthetase/AMP-(fatty) acid ligase
MMHETSLTPLHSLFTNRIEGSSVCHDGQHLVAWSELSKQVAAQVEVLRKRKESRWLLVSDNPRNFVINLLALLHAKKNVVIPPNTQRGTQLLLADEFDAIVNDELPYAESSVELLPLNPDTTSIDIYTSGSTGNPKKIRKTLTQFEAEIETLESLWGTLIGNAAIVSTVPHYHIYGLIFRLLWPLAAGRTFDTITCTNPETLSTRLAVLGQANGSILISSPAQLSRLPALVSLATLTPIPRVIFSSGGPLTEATASEFLRQHGRAPIEVFGSTETGGIAWRQQDGKKDAEAWMPLPGVKVTCGSSGALSLSSPFLADNAPWLMDDAIESLSDGRFYLRGRLDRIVKVEEKRLSLPDMETRLVTHPWVSSAATAVLAGRRQSIGAVVVLTAEGSHQLDLQGKRNTAQHLRQHLAAHFEAVLLPRRWRFAEQLPMNDGGKLTHAALTALLTADENGHKVNQTAP